MAAKSNRLHQSILGKGYSMDASTYGKYVVSADVHMDEAMDILDMGVKEEISEGCALLCADTQIMLAIMNLEDVRFKLKARMRNLGEGV